MTAKGTMSKTMAGRERREEENFETPPNQASERAVVDQYRLSLTKSQLVTETELVRENHVLLLAVKQRKNKFTLKVINWRSEIEKEWEYYRPKIVNYGIMFHQNIIRFYGFFENSRNLYVLFERGMESMEQRLSKDKYFEEGQAAIFIHQICLALQYMHNLGVFHGDVNPSNMFMMADGKTLKLADFSSSSVVTEITKTAMRGSPQYIAPEILYGPRHTYSVDMWSIGVCLFQFITGVTPFGNGRGVHINASFSLPKTMSKEAKEVISNLVVVAQDERMTANEMVNNAWIHKMIEEQEQTIVRCQIQEINNCGSRGKPRGNVSPSTVL